MRPRCKPAKEKPMNDASAPADLTLHPEETPVDSAILAPISPEAPTGSDLAYDPDFAQLSQEIEKLASVSGELPDWPAVATSSTRILRERSKDLRVMTWLVAAQSFVNGWQGLASGLATLTAMSERYWPELYPPTARLRARAAQVGWLWGLLAKRVAALAVTAADAPVVRSLEPLLGQAAAFFADNLQNSDPGVGVLRSALREKIRSLPEPAAPPPTPSAAPPGAAVANQVQNAFEATRATESTAAVPSAPARVAPDLAFAQAAVAGTDVASDASLDQVYDAARSLREPMLRLAHHARAVARDSAWSYRVLRQAAWLTVERAPAAEGDTTPLRGPKAQDREWLASLAEQGLWDALIDAAEEAVAENIFWLDPHRLGVLALTKKGRSFDAAKAAIERELASFLARAPRIHQMKFSNGSPFADPETASWIDEHICAPARGANDASGAATAGDDAVRDLEQQLSSLSSDDILARVLSEGQRVPSAKAQFRLQLAVAKAARRDKREDVARALYERLLAQVDAAFERWEPELAADVLGGLLQVLQQLTSGDRADGFEHARMRELFQRLVMVDPHAALRFRV